MAETVTVAGGDVRPSRFVKAGATDFRVLQAGANERAIGISRKGTRNPPYEGLNDGLLAKVGENCPTHGLGDTAPLELGGSVTRGDRLRSDANGRGVTATAAESAYAVAKESGASGEIILVDIIFDTIGAS